MRNSTNPDESEGTGTASAAANGHGMRTTLAAERLRELIVTGTLKPRQRIPERTLLEQFPDLSRTPLREALKILAAEGLVELHPNRGARVTQLTRAQIEDAIEVLIGLESVAAPLSCARVTDAEIDEIQALHHKMLVSFEQQDLLAYFGINQAIHQKIVDGAHNPALSRIYQNEAQQIRRYRFAGNSEHSRWAHAVAEHGQILEALQSRDGLLLRELLRSHHLKGWKVARTMVADELG